MGRGLAGFVRNCAPGPGAALEGSPKPVIGSRWAPGGSLAVAFTCRECGAVYDLDSESCASRFDALLALDHSRAEPWGSRHSLAFAAFALQHPRRFPREVVERAWILLLKVYREGEDHKRVTQALRQFGKQNPNWGLPPLPAGEPDRGYGVTIASLGSFAPETYSQKLDAWCRAALAGWCDPPEG